MRKLLILLLVCQAAFLQAQHSFMFSQYMFNGLAINPAYAGNRDVLTIVAEHRDQWTGFEGAPKTSSLTAHTPLKNKKINIGISFISDRYGITRRNKLDVAYAYRITFEKSTLFFGLQGGVNLLHDQWSEVQTNDPGDRAFVGLDEWSTIPEAGVGVYYKTEKFYAGLSAPSLLTSGKAGQVYKPTMLHTGYVFFLPNDIRLKHSILAKYVHGSPIELDINTNAYYKNLGLGFSYRTNDAVVFLLEFEINSQFKAGYSYDVSITKLGTYNKGSHEVMLRYEFGYGIKVTNPIYF